METKSSPTPEMVSEAMDIVSELMSLQQDIENQKKKAEAIKTRTDILYEKSVKIVREEGPGPHYAAIRLGDKAVSDFLRNTPWKVMLDTLGYAADKLSQIDAQIIK